MKVQKLSYPRSFTKDCCSIVTGLLAPNPQKRLGMMRGGVAELKSHPWFSDLNWVDIENRRAKVPYSPPVKSPMDVSLFDEYPSSDEEAEDYVGDESWFASF